MDYGSNTLFEVRIGPCNQNLLPSGKTCKTKSQIDKYLLEKPLTLYLNVGQDYVDSEEYKNPIKTKFDGSIIEPIVIKKGAKHSVTLASIKAVDLTFLDSVYGSSLVDPKEHQVSTVYTKDISKQFETRAENGEYYGRVLF